MVHTMKTLGMIGLTSLALAQERQLTHAPYGHVLTNVNVWSPDSRWIVYDVRTVDSVFDGARIEQVEVATGKVQTLYEARNGAACGVVTYHPREPKIVFIHGPEHPAPEWSYGMTRRRGAVVDVRRPGAARSLDAMNYAPPFTPGALRGGSHVHVFSPDGAWVSNTYEDDVLARFGAATGEGAIAISISAILPCPCPRQPRAVSAWCAATRAITTAIFSVVVTRTVNRPKPGSDEISRAFEEAGWAGCRPMVAGSSRFG